MAWLGAAAPYIGMGISAIGSMSSAKAQKSQGKAAQKQAQISAHNEQVAAEFEASQADYLATQAKAVSYIEAHEQRRMAALLASRSLALAAASGAGASDPSVVDLIGQIYTEGAYRSALAMYEGEEAARSYTVAGQARRLGGASAASAKIYEGKSIANASKINATSTLISGASSLFSSFGSLKSSPATSSGPYIAPGQATARGGAR